MMEEFPEPILGRFRKSREGTNHANRSDSITGRMSLFQDQTDRAGSLGKEETTCRCYGDPGKLYVEGALA